MFFTDPGHSALEDPHGRVFAWQEGGAAAPVLQGLPFPNGVVVMPEPTGWRACRRGTVRRWWSAARGMR